ncbi:MAG: ParB/RepB/Spo0J family partition protein [Pseudomonadota bacterium]
MAAAAKKKEKGLGRGLDALLGDVPVEQPVAPEPAASAGGPKSTLPVAFLKPNPEQPRRAFNDDALQELADSVKARGMLQPILVRPMGADAYEIVAGERRWRAAQRAKLHDVPVVIRELTDEEAAEIALIENVQRVDLNPMEEAEAYKRLGDVYGRTQQQIARAVGKSRSHVANIMRLLALPAQTRRAVAEDAITMGHARALLGADDPDALCETVLKDGLSVRQTETLVKESGDGGTDRPRPSKPGARGPKDADTRALEADLAAALGLDVEIEHTPKGAGAVTIRYLTLDQLDDVCRRLMDARV